MSSVQIEQKSYNFAVAHVSVRVRSVFWNSTRLLSTNCVSASPEDRYELKLAGR